MKYPIRGGIRSREWKLKSKYSRKRKNMFENTSTHDKPSPLEPVETIEPHNDEEKDDKSTQVLCRSRSNDKTNKEVLDNNFVGMAIAIIPK